jgi:hypothetical protein
MLLLCWVDWLLLLLLALSSTEGSTAPSLLLNVSVLVDHALLHLCCL